MLNIRRMALFLVLLAGASSAAAEEPARILREDFETTPTLFNHRHLQLAPGEGPGGSTAVRAAYVGYEEGSERMVISHRLAKIADEYTLCYDVRFDEDFQFVLGGKLHGFGPDRPVSGGRAMRPDGWSARVTFGREGAVRSYLYQQDQAGVYGTSETRPGGRFQPGEWQSVSLHVKINDVGESNGYARIYLDGELVVSHDGVRFRDEEGDHTLISRFLFSTFHGGSNPLSAPMKEDGSYATVHALFDNLAVYSGEHVRVAPGQP